MKYSYMGTSVPWWCPVCVYEGWEDGSRRIGQLYRRPLWKQVGWAIGNIIGRNRF